MKCDVDIHKEVYANVVPSGGTAMMRSRRVTPIRYDLEDLVNELPDRNIITVGAQRFLHVEVLYQPNFIGDGASEIHDTTLQCNMKCGVYTRKFLYASVVLSTTPPCSKGLLDA